MSQNDDESINKISRMLEIGGTMLAQHCAECGAPLFRYKGNVICPVCDTGPKPSVQAQEKIIEKKMDTSEFSSNTEDKQQVVSSVNVLPSPSDLSGSIHKTFSLSTETPDKSRPVSGSSLADLEMILLKKTVMLGNSMHQEQDPRKVKEFLELIEQCLDIIDRLNK